MMIRRLLLLCCCLFFCECLLSQVYYIDKRFWRGKDAFIDIEQAFEFDVFPYSDPMLDLRGFKLMHPEIANRIPEYIEVVPPNLSELRNPSFAVAWVGVREDNEIQGQLIVMIVGKFTDEQPRYYPDRNLDRVFTNDSDPVVFHPGHTQESVRFAPADGEGPAIDISLIAPAEYQEFLYKREQEARKVATPETMPAEIPESSRLFDEHGHPRSPEEKCLQKFDVRFGLTFGLNRINYAYRRASTGFPVTYEVSNSSKGIFLNTNYRHRGLRLGMVAGIEHSLWWTSFKTIRVSDPYEVCVPDSCYFVPGVEVERNRDRLPELRLNIGLNLEYLFKIVDRVRIGPYIAPMFTTYRPSTYIPEVTRPEQTHTMGPDFSFEGGVRIELHPLDNQALVFSAAWTESRFLPNGFFEDQDIRLTGLFRQHRGIRAYLGYAFWLN
ncbi:MAG: hypothetical protein AAF998_20900 [Bacteroidota bacterium]